MPAASCRWCEKPLTPGRQPKKFCGAHCRGSFHEACRHYGERQFDTGRITLDDLHQERTAA